MNRKQFRASLTALMAFALLLMPAAALAQDPTVTPTATRTAAATAAPTVAATRTATANPLATAIATATASPLAAATATTVASTATPTVTPIATAAAATPTPTVSPGIEITVYNQNVGLIKEVRVLQLEAGVNPVRFTDVAAGIQPATVHFVSLSDPEGTRVLEQNYEYDLVDSQRLLARYVDQEIVVRTVSGERYAGTLLSGTGDLVLLTADGVQVITPGQIQEYTFPVLPDGLITRPTLAWLLQAAQAGEQQVRVTYLTSGLNWQADYVAVLAADATELSLAGWVTVDNQSGATYQDAHLKLVAGDVHYVSQPALVRADVAEAAVMATPAVVERSFFEYHLYDVQRPVTLQDRQTKQIEFATADGVAARKVFVYEASPEYVVGMVYADAGYGVGSDVAVQVHLEFTNSAAGGLGIPLPQGTVRVYQEDTDGGTELVGEDAIDHTPVDEELSLYLGDAFDLAGERVQTDYNSLGETGAEETYRITLRNHKAEAVTVQVVEHLFRSADAEITASNMDYEMLDATTARFAVPIRANGEAEVTYTVRYTW